LIEEIQRRYSDSLKELPYSPDYKYGAKNAITTCLKVQPGEIMTIVTDLETMDIAASLLAAAQAAGAIVTSYVIEDYCERPIKDMPIPILEAIAGCQVGLYAVQSQVGEMPARKQFVGQVEKNGVRYAHMVSISPEIMRQGMRADYNVVNAIGQKILNMVESCHTINCTTEAGTDIEATFDPELLWIKTCGMITPHVWSNLPAGEVFTAPSNVNGIYVVDGTIGDYFCQKYGNLAEYPLFLEIENNRLRSIKCDNHYLQAELWRYVHLDENSNRVGEFAIGANIGVSKMIYNLLQDEKLPGMHIALGDPVASQTRATWSAPTHVDAIARDCNIWIDGNQIMRGGRFLFLSSKDLASVS